MPFTPTHVIAVVPLRRLFHRVPFSALAIGAMVPDLPLLAWITLRRILVTAPDDSRVVSLPARWKRGVWITLAFTPLMVAVAYWAPDMTIRQLLFFACVRSALFGLSVLLIHSLAFHGWMNKQS